MAIRAARAKPPGGGRHHLLRRHIGVADQAGQTNLPRAILTQPAHAHPLTGGADQLGMQKDPPFFKAAVTKPSQRNLCHRLSPESLKESNQSSGGSATGDV